MRNILLPVDGSSSSASALEYVVSRKKRGERLKVTVLYVQPTPLVMNKEIENILLEEQLKVFSEKRIAAADRLVCYNKCGRSDQGEFPRRPIVKSLTLVNARALIFPSL